MRRRHSPPPTAPAVYRIQLQGCVAPRWSDWFGGLALSEEYDPGGLPQTTLVGLVPDQPALRGILNKLWDLNLTLIAVERLAQPGESERID